MARRHKGFRPSQRLVLAGSGCLILTTMVACVMLSSAALVAVAVGQAAPRATRSATLTATATPRPVLTTPATAPEAPATGSPSPIGPQTPRPSAIPTSIPSPTPTAAALAAPSLPTVTSTASQVTSAKDGMTLIAIPAGDFLMGSDSADASASNDSKPVHTVTLDAYWIDQSEVTNAMYIDCVAAGACPEPMWTRSDSRVNYLGNPAFSNYPVVGVSWGEASSYCAWVGGRLPTEAEWEKAARGENGWLFPWGNDPPTAERANYDSLNLDTAAVGSYPLGTSPYGLFDMAGNAWEWVADWYSTNYYETSLAESPLGPETGTERVVRGGDWQSIEVFLRTTNRDPLLPGRHSIHIGFRCVRPGP